MSGIHVNCVVEPLNNNIEGIKVASVHFIRGTHVCYQINKDKIQDSSVYRCVVNSYIAEARPGFTFMSKYHNKVVVVVCFV